MARAKQQPTLYLSDRGIQQAISQGLLCFDPPLSDDQLQPASVDLRLSHIDEVFPLEEMSQGATGPAFAALRASCIARGTYADLVCTQRMGWRAPLRFRTELRSSLRRLSCYTPTGLTMMLAENRLHVEVKNSGPIDISLHAEDKIAQLLFFFYKEMGVGLHEAGLSGYEKMAEDYERLLSCDHGHAIDTSRAARKLVADGYITVTPQARFERGLLRVHAGKTARVLRDGVKLDFSKKEDISAAFKTVDLPYRLLPAEHLVVDVQEHLSLSPHVGVQFFDYLLGTSRGLSFSYPRRPGKREIVDSLASVISESVVGSGSLSVEDSSSVKGRWPPHVARTMADISLSNIPDGWVDPGYVGTFSRQPKTYYPGGVVIHEGDLLGHGMMVFFPNPVGRAYGSAGLGSHYQGQKETKITQ